MFLSLQRSITAIAGALTLAAIAVPATASADVPSNQLPGGLLTAIQEEVQFQGHQYAGLCRDIEQHAHLGKYCASVLSLSETYAEVTYGPVLSEPTAHVGFIKVDGQWTHPGGGPGEGEPGAIPQDLRDAVRDYVQDKGYTYAGLCNEIPQDGSTLGQYCANLTDLTTGSVKVHYGPVASNDLTTVRFVNQGGSWQAQAQGPHWVNDLQYGSAGGGFYWDNVSNRVWTAERGWHSFSPQPAGGVNPLWVNHLTYGSIGGGFYLDPLAGQVWTAERGWHFYSPA